jgi:hypothetical protein
VHSFLEALRNAAAGEVERLLPTQGTIIPNWPDEDKKLSVGSASGRGRPCERPGRGLRKSGGRRSAAAVRPLPLHRSRRFAKSLGRVARRSRSFR